MCLDTHLGQIVYDDDDIKAKIEIHNKISSVVHVEKEIKQLITS